MSFFKKIENFFSGSYNELMNNVTWTKMNELTSSTVLVLVGTVVFALLVASIDIAFKNGVSLFYSQVITTGAN